MPDQLSTEAKGSGEVTLGENSCLISLACEHGHFWETIWNHPDNAALKAARKDPRVLRRGDRIHIPPIEIKQESGATAKRHTFRRKGVPAKFRLRVLAEGEPVKGESWRADVGGGVLSGKTDSNGILEFTIPPSAAEARIDVGQGESTRRFRVRLGRLDPPDTPSGVQQRLTNLGFLRAKASDSLDAVTRRAIRQFQADEGLEVTGEASDETLDALRERHGS